MYLLKLSCIFIERFGLVLICVTCVLSRTTLQTLYQATESARQNNYYVGGLSHTWMTYYLSQLTDDYLIRNEW